MGASHQVLNWLREGVQVWPRGSRELRGFRGQNKWRSSAEEAWALDELRTLVAQGAARPAQPGELSLVSGVRLVPKDPGSADPRRHYRMVIRMMKLNDALAVRKFSLQGWREWVQALKQGWWGARIDLAQAYHNVPMSTSAHQWLGVRVAGREFVLLGLPFGLKTAPWVFCRIMRDMVRHLRSLPEAQGCLVNYFYDDVAVAGPTREAAARCEKAVWHAIGCLGWARATHKRTGISQTPVYLGVVCDTTTGHVRLEDDKAQRYARNAKTLADAMAKALSRATERDQPNFRSRQLASVVGQLTYAASVHPGLRIFVRPLYWSLHELQEPDQILRATYTPSWALVQVLRECSRRLRRAQKRGTTAWPSPFVHEIFSDASGVRGGGWGADCPTLRARISGGWPDPAWDEDPAPVPLKELHATRRALEFWGPRLQGQAVRARLDSQTVVAILIRGGAHGIRPAYTNELKALADAIERFDLIWTEPEWVPREENQVADMLSKARIWAPKWACRSAPFDAGLRHDDWGPRRSWLAQGLSLVGAATVTMDAYASDTSARAPVFRAAFPTQGAAGVGANAAPEWHRRNALVLAVPPLRKVDEAVSLALAAAATTILFVPRWPDQAWWSQLQEAQARWTCFGEWPAARAHRARGSELEGNDKWTLVGLVVWGRTDTRPRDTHLG